MEIIAHYKGGKLYDVITSKAEYYNQVLNINITDRLIRNEDGTLTQMWDKLSPQEFIMAKELINGNNYITYVSFMRMKVRDDKVDKLLNENY